MRAGIYQVLHSLNFDDSFFFEVRSYKNSADLERTGWLEFKGPI